MNQELIFLPVLGHILLVLWLYILLGKVKFKATKEGRVDKAKAALHAEGWPDDVLQVINNLKNQFESPILFYVLSIVFFLLNEVSMVVLVLSVVYMLSRYVHAYVHVTSNYVPMRLRAFLVGILITLLLSLYLVFLLLNRI